jgi:alpha-galactosidase
MEPEGDPSVVAPSGVRVEYSAESDGTVRWAVANEQRVAASIERVALRFQLRTRGRVRVFRHGYQSWSATGVATLGADEDPSRTPGAISLIRNVHHADGGVAPAGELRSELVTVVADDDGAWCFGFEGGRDHDGTFRVRSAGDDLVEIDAEAHLGGARLAAGTERRLHAVRTDPGDPLRALEQWAGWAGAAAGARTDAPYQVGWCSWYQYFHGVTEHDVRANLARAGDWPIDVFQLDDGYQAEIGDWLRRKDTFPGSLDALARDIDRAGYVPGIWIAPFIVSPNARLAHEHPEWIPHHASGRPLVGLVNDGWGGVVHVLDTTHPEVLAHLEHLARTLVDMGWRYLKLDFTFTPSFAATDWHDPTATPAQRVRAGYDAIRRGAGDDTFLLGCGAPLGACIGAVDGMRIGPDVAPSWDLPAGAWRPPGYEDCQPATMNAWRNTLTRAFQHRRLWANDPDCLMLRTADTALSEQQVETWARAVAASGGLALLSDDLALLDAPARRLLDDVLAVGRAVDDAARAGTTPRCPDLLERDLPTTLRTDRVRLVADPERGLTRAWTAPARTDPA